jgi:predicted permease
VLAYLGLKAFVAINPLGTLPSNEVGVNGHVLVFTLALTILAMVLFGSAPAIRASRVDLNEVMKSARGRTATGRGRRAQGILLSVQICLTMVVLVATGLLTKTLIRLSSQPIGIVPEKVAVMEIGLPKQDFPTAMDVNRFYGRLVKSVQEVPGVEVAAATTTDPVYGTSAGGTLIVEGQTLTGTDAAPQVQMATITPGYFSALSVPLLRGRSFSNQDNQSSEPVIIISNHVALSFFRGENPIGKRVRIGDEKLWRKIIGVVGDVRFKRGGADRNALEWVTGSQVYTVHWQAAEERFNPVNRHVYVYLRGPRLPEMPELRHLIETLNPDVPVTEYEPLKRIIGDVERQARLRTVVLSGFAILALILAALGIYGVVSQSVIQRTNEIGVRMALGADSTQVRSMVIREGLCLAVGGITMGIVCSLLLLRIIASLLYGVTPSDPVALGLACTLLLGVVAIASYLPARRASRVEPIQALHYE